MDHCSISLRLAEQVIFLKRLMFGSSGPLHLLRVMGVSVSPLHIESTDSMIWS